MTYERVTWRKPDGSLFAVWVINPHWFIMPDHTRVLKGREATDEGERTIWSVYTPEEHIVSRVPAELVDGMLRTVERRAS